MPTDLPLTDDLLLRPARPEDHARHLAMMRRIYPPAFAYLWPDDGAWYIDRVHGENAYFRDLKTPGAPYYHVYYKEVLTGIFRLRLNADCPDFPDEKALKLDRIYLDPAARGNGIGSTLVRYAKSEAARRGKALLWLERMSTNDATINFYRKHGFTDGETFRLTMELMYEELRGMQRVWCRV